MNDMGYFWHSVKRFGPPFLLVDEGSLILPKAGVIRPARNFFKFLFILSGGIEHEIDGLEGRRPLGAGDILFAPAVKYHRFINRSRTKAARTQMVRLFLDGEVLQRRARKSVLQPEADFTDYVLHHFQRVVQISGGIDTEITELLNQLRKEVEQHRPGFRHQVHCVCKELVVNVSRKILGGEESIVPQTRQGSIVGSAKEYIIKHLARDLTLGQIAWSIGKGEEHLARMFKRETGISVFNYVRDMRVNMAKTLLLDPSLSLTVIAERCGFQSLSFFSRTFKQRVGLTPSDYRHHTETSVENLAGYPTSENLPLGMR